MNKQIVVASMACLGILLTDDATAGVTNLNEASRFLNGETETKRRLKLDFGPRSFIPGPSDVRFINGSLRAYREITHCEALYATENWDIAAICEYITVFLDQGPDVAQRWLDNHALRRNTPGAVLRTALHNNPNAVQRALTAHLADLPRFRYLWAAFGINGGTGITALTIITTAEHGRLLEQIYGDVREISDLDIESTRSLFEERS
jgi:hypothetical protein